MAEEDRVVGGAAAAPMGLCTSSCWGGVPLNAAFLSGEHPLPPTPAESNMPPNKSICPSAKIRGASHWGNCRAGPGWGPSLWREIRSVCQWGAGRGPRLLTSLQVLPVADLGSARPQVPVSALSSGLLSPPGGGGSQTSALVAIGAGWGEGEREAALPFWEQLILGRALEPPAGAVGACLGRWDVSGSPRHDHIPPDMPAGVRGAEGPAGGRGAAGGGAFGVVWEMWDC